MKLIVLDRLIELKEHPTHERVLQVNEAVIWSLILFYFIVNY